MCQNWCDIIAYTENEKIERGIIEIQESDDVLVMNKNQSDRFPILCCGGRCLL